MRLDRGAERHHLIGIDVGQRFLPEPLLDDRRTSGTASRRPPG
jgi:hypothetical protein